jgi:hypothetical protein
MSQSQLEPDQLALIPNPFEHTVVADPWDESSEDVQQINRSAFEKCLALVDGVRARASAGQHGSTSLVLTGEPGTGKTHLLARIRRHFDRLMGPTGSSLDQSAIFIGIRLNTTPALLWRHVRSGMVSSLLRPRATGPPVLRCLITGSPGQRLDQVENLNLATALEAYRDSHYVLQVSAWLRGEILPQAVLERLSLTPGDSEEMEQNTAFRVVEQLCRLIHPIPVIFCFDQIEAIQAHPEDRHSLIELGKIIADLHDCSKNVVIVTCMQTSFLDYLKDVVRGANADRWLNKNLGSLQRLKWDEACALVESRMNADQQLRELRANRPKLWPLPEAELKKSLEDGAITARKLLYRAKELFDQAVAAGIKPPVSLEESLRGQVDEYQQKAEQQDDPSDWNNSIANGLPLLLHLAGTTPEERQPGQPAWLDLSWKGNGTTGVVLCNQPHASALANRLRKINQEWNPSTLPRLLLLRDERLGISKTAKASHQYLEELQNKGAVWVNPSAEAVAALEAMRRLLADAQSGDSSYNGESVAPGTVESWMRNSMPSAVRELLRVLLGDRVQTDQVEAAEALADYLAGRCVVSITGAAADLQIPEGELIQLARDHASRFGLLEGPPAVLFRMASPAG